MSTLLLSPAGIMVQQLTNAGQPLSGGKVNIYSAGTTTPINTYTDSTGVTLNANPVILNSAGRLPNGIWIGQNTPHKMILTDANNVTLMTLDNLYGINDPTLTTSQFNTLPTAAGTANAQTVTNTVALTALTNGLDQWFLPVAANTGATTVNVDSLGAKNIFYNSKALVGAELQIGVPAHLKYDGTQWNLQHSAKAPALDYYADSGSVNALTITAAMAQTAYADGMRFKVKVKNTTTSSSTLNVNSIGAINTYYSDGTTSIAAGALIANNTYTFTYDSSLNASAGGFIVSEPSRVTGSFTITLTGMTAGTTGTVNYAIEPSGKLVNIWVASAITGTSNATTMTGTGIPAALSATTNHRTMYFPVEDNTLILAVFANGINSTTWTFATTIGGAGFTSSGTKGLPITSFSYSLD